MGLISNTWFKMSNEPTESPSGIFDKLIELFCIPMHDMAIPIILVQKASLHNAYPLHWWLCRMVRGLIKCTLPLIEHRAPNLPCGYESITIRILRKAWQNVGIGKYNLLVGKRFRTKNCVHRGISLNRLFLLFLDVSSSGRILSARKETPRIKQFTSLCASGAEQRVCTHLPFLLFYCVLEQGREEINAKAKRAKVWKCQGRCILPSCISWIGGSGKVRMTGNQWILMTELCSHQ